MTTGPQPLMHHWRVKSRLIDEYVTCETQHQAYETLRERDAIDFGLIVVAERDEDDDPIAIRTSALMFHWGREADARAFIQAAMAHGMPDTEAQDREYQG